MSAARSAGEVSDGLHELGGTHSRDVVGDKNMHEKEEKKQMNWYGVCN